MPAMCVVVGAGKSTVRYLGLSRRARGQRNCSRNGGNPGNVHHGDRSLLASLVRFFQSYWLLRLSLPYVLVRRCFRRELRVLLQAAALAFNHFRSQLFGRARLAYFAIGDQLEEQRHEENRQEGRGQHAAHHAGTCRHACARACTR